MELLRLFFVCVCVCEEIQSLLVKVSLAAVLNRNLELFCLQMGGGGICLFLTFRLDQLGNSISLE